jgi:hypothetical protein
MRIKPGRLAHPDGQGGGTGLGVYDALGVVAKAVAQVVQVRDRDGGQALIAGVAVDPEGASQQVRRARPRESAKLPVDPGQQQDVGIGKAPGKGLRRGHVVLGQGLAAQHLGYQAGQLCSAEAASGP